MLHLIGLGLNFDSISNYGLKALKRCKKVYLETYTVNFPYSKTKLAEALGKKFIPVNRDFVESPQILKEAVKTNVALLVYGSPLTATTHITLIDEARKSGIKTQIIYNASIIDAVAETGLQAYKFGKITSMPTWNEKKNYMPTSFMEILKENLSIGAHTLILIDIGLYFPDAWYQLKKASEKFGVDIKNILICQALGTNQSKIFYKKFEDVSSFKIRLPYCIIIPGKLHFIEKEFLESFNN